MAARPYAEVYDELKGDVLENGECFDEAIARVYASSKSARHGLLELGVEMEFQAYDLYRNLAASYPDTEVERVLLELAVQETIHFRLALSALGQAVAEYRRTQAPA